MKIKKLIFSCVAFFVIFAFCGCSKKNKDEQKSSANNTSQNIGSFITQGVVTNQLDSPKKGEEIVVFTVKDYGVIKCRLFPQAAPKAVEKFKKNVKDKKYDGSLFYRVVEDFVVQGGKEGQKEGQTEKVNSANNLQIELNRTLHHFNGALCMARSDSKINGQGNDFYFVSSEHGKKVDFNFVKNSTDSIYKEDGINITVDFDEKTKKTYKEKGGRPDLDMLYTIIGQIFEGQDVIKKIQQVPKKTQQEQDSEFEPNSVPQDQIVIEKAELCRA